MNTETAFEEKAPYGWWIKLFLPAIIAIVLFAYFYALTVVGAYPKHLNYISLLVFVLCAISLWIFYTVKFGADKESVFIRAGPFAYRILRKDIQSVEVLQNVPFYAGWGIRVLWWNNWAVGFITQHAASLVISKKSGVFKKVVMSVNDPNAFIKKAKLKPRR